MIRKISDILNEKDKTLSFEFFPPKTQQGRDNLFRTIEVFKEFNPDFVSVTYGTGGGSKELTMKIVDEIQKRFGIPAMHHLTVIGHSLSELRSILRQMQDKDICNILALYGDIPEGINNFKKPAGSLSYCFELCQLIRSYDDYFSVGVAGFPEGHVDAPDKETDLKYLKIKLDSGGQFVITQFFFDNADYFDYVKRAKIMGINQRIIPGTLPIANYRKMLEFSTRCGATVTEEIHNLFQPLVNNERATSKAAVDFSTKQCRQLLKGGAPGLHFFTLNKIDPTRGILKRLFKQ